MGCLFHEQRRQLINQLKQVFHFVKVNDKNCVSPVYSMLWISYMETPSTLEVLFVDSYQKIDSKLYPFGNTAMLCWTLSSMSHVLVYVTWIL